MIDRVPDWFIAMWTALSFWIATNIEPSQGVLAAAFFGSMLSFMTGTDRGAAKGFLHIALGCGVGVFGSQVVAELVSLRIPNFRVGFAFFLALFAEKVIASGRAGTLLESLVKLRTGK